MSKSFVVSNLLIFLLLFFMSPSYPDTITLKTGYVIKGLIIQEEGHNIIVKDKGGETTLKKEKILEINYNPDYLIDWADEYLKDRDYEKAISTYEEVLNSYKGQDGSILKYKIARCYLNLKLPSKAVPYLEELKESPKLGKKAEALLLRIKKKREKALAAKKEAERKAREAAKAKKEREDKAADLCKQAEEEYNKIKALKWHYTNLPKYNEVIENCSKIIKDFPKTEASLEAQFLIMQCYEQQAEYEKGFEALDKYCDMAAHYYNEDRAAEVIKQMADKFFDKGEYADAQQHYEMIIKKYPKTNYVDYVHYRIGDCFDKTKKYNAAYKKYERFLKDYPDSKYLPDVLSELPFLYHRNKQYEKEMVTLRKIIREYPEYYKCDWAQYNIFLCLFEQEKYEEAKKEYEVLLQNYPDSNYIEYAQRYLENLTNSKSKG